MRESSSFYHTPVLIIGAGIAGCAAALNLADRGIQVTLIAAGRERENGNSWLAQGGIIYKAEQGDPKLLEKDIFVAGHAHNNPRAVRLLAANGPKVVEDVLIKRLRTSFAQPEPGAMLREGEWDLTREGGHSAPRILHCADHTGRSIMECFTRAVRASPNIHFLPGHSAVDLLTSHHHTGGMTYRYQLANQCCGAYVFNEEHKRVDTLLADYTVLACGGAGQIYLHSTNNPCAIGSAIAMASRAFVRLENLEFVQFHPTAFYHQDSPRFLVSEAMRGEGGVLVNARGERFMRRYDAREDLAPRDIVAQAIILELLKYGEPCVFLDARGIRQDLKERFPTIYAHCLKYGVDMEKDPIPVVPAAHYFCGGILTDLCGRTTLDRLYSVGEASCTGLHGANRLASTSLLEALLWGHNAAEDIKKRLNRPLENRLRNAIREWTPLGDECNDDPALILQDWVSIRSIMWNYVGIHRTSSRLHRAFEDLRDLSLHLHSFYRRTPLSKPLVDLFQGCQAAYVLTQSALRNKESLGCHQIMG